MGGRVALTAVVGLLAVAGCGGAADDGAKTSAIGDLAPVALPADSPTADWDDAATTAGTCLGPGTLGDTPEALAEQMDDFGIAAYRAMADDPVWTARVACDEPHAYEVYAVVGLPDELGEQVTSYADVIGGDPGLAKAIWTAVTHGCATAFEPSVEVMEAAPLQIDVLPVVNAQASLTLTANPLPPSDWDAGRRGFACLLTQDPAGTVRAADLGTKDLPLAARVCLSDQEFTSCGEPHDAERIAVLSVDAAVATGALRGRQAVDAAGNVNLGDTEWSMLDEVCDRYLRQVSIRPAPGLVGVANTYPESYPDAAGSYRVICSAQSAFGTRPGDVVVTSSSVFDQ